MPEDSPIPIAATSKSGRVVRRKKGGLKVKRGKAKSTLKNDQRKLKEAVEMKNSSSGADEMDGGMECCHHLIMSSARLESGPDGSSRKVLPWDTLLMAFKDQIFSYAERALESYNNENPEHDEFEVVQALHAQKRLLYPLGTKDDSDNTREWCHVFFVGRSKKDGTEENFFAELMRPESEALFTVKSCSTLEPGDFDDEDFDHGCLICPPGLLLHPQKGQFLADISSYQPVKWKTL